MTHSYVTRLRHDSFICNPTQIWVSRVTYEWVMSRTHVWQEARHICKRKYQEVHVTWLIHMWHDLIPSDTLCMHMHRASFACVTCMWIDTCTRWKYFLLDWILQSYIWMYICVWFPIIYMNVYIYWIFELSSSQTAPFAKNCFKLHGAQGPWYGVALVSRID